MATLSLFWKLVRQSLRAQLEYPTNFALQWLAYLLISVAEFVALWALFSTFGSLAGWTLAEVAVFYGIANAGIALADSLSYGFDRFALLLKSGDFDRMLLRPLRPTFQLLASDLRLRRFARVLQALVVLSWGLSELAAPFAAAQCLVLIAAILAGALIFLGLWIFQAALTFYTIETLEVMNILTYGGAQLGQHPLSIFPPFMRRLFVGLVPVGLVTYYPGLFVMNRIDPLGAPPWVGLAAPLAGPLFLLLSLWTFSLAVRRYASTGS